MKKKQNILINGCSQGLGLDFYKYLQKKFNLFGVSSKKTKNKDIFYYDPIKNPVPSKELIKGIESCKIDHIIHCVGGGFKKYDKFLELKELIELFNVNFFSIYEINKIILKNKAKSKKINIIMIGSIAALEDKASLGYSAAKSVLINYNKNLAAKFFKDNVVTKLLIPGSFISTNGSMSRLKKNKPRIYKNIESLLPNGKFQKSNDIIKLCELLLKKETDFLNGSYLSMSNLESKSIFL